MAFGQFSSSLYHTVNSKSFMNDFCQFSKDSDRHAMIEMIMQVEVASKLEIKPFYTPKDQTKAQKLFDDVKNVHEKSGYKIVLSKIDELTKALFAADVDSFLYIETLITRAKSCFSIGFYTRCSKDCDLAIESLKTKSIDLLNNSEQHMTVCNALKNHCMKLMSKSRERNWAPKLPKIDEQTNKKLTNASNALSLVYNPTKGRHLIASRNIKAGAVLIVDEPYAFSTDQQALLTNCLHCQVSLGLDGNIQVPCRTCQTVAFCSGKCREEARRSYHKYECTILNNLLNIIPNNLLQRSHLLLAYRMTLSKAINKDLNTLDPEFLCYQDVKCEDAKKSLEIDIHVDTYSPLDYRTVYSLETHCGNSEPKVNLARAIKAVFLAKCLLYSLGEIEPQKTRETVGPREIVLLAVAMMRHIQAIDCNAYEIVENFRDDLMKTWEPRNVGGAIYTTVSLVNHGCYPNVIRHSYPGGKVVVRSLRFINKGAEILDCYGPHFISDPLQMRQSYLQEKYHFKCTCDPCRDDWKLPLSNEITFRCSCGHSLDSISSRCSSCSCKIDMKKLTEQLAKSAKKRVAAIIKMFDGDYVHALPLLLEHNSFVDKILVAPSLESLKTQQSIVQCFNSMANVCKKSEETKNY